jgi:hypothetical protein
MLKMLKLSKLAKRLGMATTIGRLAVTHPPAYRESNPWGAANLFAVKILRSHSFRYAESPGSLNGIIESKKSAEWWNMINDKNREWTDGPKHQES